MATAPYFTRPFFIESRGAVASLGSLTCMPCRQRAAAGLQGLGESTFWDVINPKNVFEGAGSFVGTLWDKISGASANREAQLNAIKLAELKAQAEAQAAIARAQMVKTSIPWLVGGALILVGGAVMVAMVRKGK